MSRPTQSKGVLTELHLLYLEKKRKNHGTNDDLNVGYSQLHYKRTVWDVEF